MRPVVDGLETKYKGQVNVIRIDIQDNPGRAVAPELGVLYTPTFILFDAKGKIILRHVGELDPKIIEDALKSGK